MVKRNLLFTLSYDGRAYHGYQVQKNALTVAEVFQDAVERVFGARLDVTGCSRTDSGVHAKGFCVLLSTEKAIPCEKAVKALNHYLPRDIAVTACQEVAEGFHPRYSSLGKQYRYCIWNAPYRSPFWEGFAYHYPYPLDVPLLDVQCRDFVGEHDFSAFCSAGNTVEDKIRCIYACSVRREGQLVVFEVTGSGFLYNMVRIMTGTLLDISQGSIPAGSVPEILASRNRKKAGATAPACGLYLQQVYYDLPGWPKLPGTEG